MYGFFGRNTASASNAKNEVNFEGELRFTVQHLKHVHRELVENKVVTSKNVVTVIEHLRTVAEMVVYGDSNSEQLFDFFCEKNMMALFIEIMWSPNCPGSVHMQILQTLGILCQSVKNDTSLYYLLSNNYVNEIIQYPHNFENENISEQFVSFLKTLSLRLNLQSVQFFFIEDTGAFPLLTRAIGLLQFKEPMVRIAAQAIILNVYKVRDKRSRDYALQPEIMNRFFKNIVQFMTGQYNALVALSLEHINVSLYGVTAATNNSNKGNSRNRTVSSVINDNSVVAKIEELMHDLIINIEDWLFYLQDVIDLGIMKLRRCLIQYLFEEFVQPVLLAPLEFAMESSGSGGGRGNRNENVFKTRKPSVSRRLSSNGSPSPEDQTPAPDPEGLTNSAALVVSLMYMQMMLHHIGDEMMRRAIMVALLHPTSRKERKRILVAYERSLDSNRKSTGSCHSTPASSYQSATSSLFSDDEGCEKDETRKWGDMSGDAEGERDELVQQLGQMSTLDSELSLSGNGNGQIKIKPDYFSKTIQRPSIDEETNFLRASSIAFRSTMTLSTVDFGGLVHAAKGNGNPHFSCSNFSSYCGGIANSRSKYINVFRCSFQYCLLGNTERYSLLCLLLLYAATDKWITHAMTAQVVPLTALQNAGQTQPKKDHKTVELMAPAEIAVNILRYLQGLHAFPKVVEGHVEELFELFAMAPPSPTFPTEDQTKKTEEKDDVSEDMYSDSDSEEEYFHRANRPIPEEIDDIESDYDATNPSGVLIPSSVQSQALSGSGTGSLRASISSGSLNRNTLAPSTTGILSKAEFINQDVLDLRKLEIIMKSPNSNVLVGQSQTTSANKGTVFSSFGGASPPPISTIKEDSSGSNGGALSLTESLIQVLYDATNHTLTSLQVSAHAMYNILRLVHLVTSTVDNTTTAQSDESNSVAHKNFMLQKRSSIEQSARLCIKWYLSQLHGAYMQSVNAVLERTNSPKGDSLLNILQEELTRLNNSKWNVVANKMSQDILLLLMPTPSICLRMGLEHSIPISLMELIRREVQVFILLRCLVRQVEKLLPAETVQAVPVDRNGMPQHVDPNTVFKTTSNDLFRDVVDDELLPFSEKPDSHVSKHVEGDIVTSATEVLVLGQTIQVSDYICIKGSTVLYYSLGENGSSNSDKMRSPPNSSGGGYGTPSRSLMSGGGKGSVGTWNGMLVCRRVGDVVFILNNTRLILATVNDDEGLTATVRIVAPIIHTDVSIDSSDKRNLRILVRSSEPVPLMSRVGGDVPEAGAYAEAPSPVRSRETDTKAEVMTEETMTLITATNSLFTGVSNLPTGGNAVVSRQQVLKSSPCALKTRQQSTLWQLTLRCDNEEDCTEASRHIEIRRSQERMVKLELLKASLSSWIEKSSKIVGEY